MYWSPDFLAVVFKKQEISQQVVTRMQNLASEFSKSFRGWYPRTLTAGWSDPFRHPTPSPAFGIGLCAYPNVLCWDPNFQQQEQHFIAQKHKTCACARTRRSYARHNTSSKTNCATMIEVIKATVEWNKATITISADSQWETPFEGR